MGKKNEIYNSWVETKRITKSMFTKFDNADTTKTKKYLDIMCFFWYYRNEMDYYIGNSKTIIETIMDFEKLLPYIEDKDINSYRKSFSSLVVTVEGAKMDKEDKTFNRAEHIDVLFEDENYLLVRPKTFDGSLKYGYNTKWCTASKSNPYTFKNYVTEGYLFYLNIKNKALGEKIKNNKLAFYLKKTYGGPMMGEIMVYDEKDRQMYIEQLVRFPEDIYGMVVKCMSLLREHAFAIDEVSRTKKSLTDAMRLVSSIDIDDILAKLNKVSQNDEEFAVTFRQNMLSLMEKIS
jgi:hypothetical protein